MEQNQNPDLTTGTTEVSTETPVVQPVEVPELVYEYQPVDEHNRPLGGKQVIKYKTQDELIDKITKQNIELVRLNRNLNKRVRLGNFEEDQIPDTVIKVSNDRPRILTVDERVQLSRDILDPEKFDQAADVLFETKLGMKPEAIQKKLTSIDRLEARAEAEAFVASTPGYYKCPENFEMITDWMVKNGLAPIRSNFDYAYQQLKVAGLLLEAPIVREDVPRPDPVVTEQTVVNSQLPQDETSRIANVETAPVTRTVTRIPSGLTRDISSQGGPITNANLDDSVVYEHVQIVRDGKGKPTGQEIRKVYKGLQALDVMPSEEYAKRLKADPEFGNKVDALEATRKRFRR